MRLKNVPQRTVLMCSERKCCFTYFFSFSVTAEYFSYPQEYKIVISHIAFNVRHEFTMNCSSFYGFDKNILQ